MKRFICVVLVILLNSIAIHGICSDSQIQENILYPYQTSIELQDEFTSGTAVTTFIGNLGWGIGGGAVSILTSETNRPGIYRRSTGAASGTLARMQLYPVSSGLFESNLPHRIVWITRLNDNDANTTYRMGSGNSTGVDPPVVGIWVEKLDGDTNWFCVTSSGTFTRTDSGVAVNTNFNVFEYKRLSASVEFYINGARVCTNTSNLPTAFVVPFTQIINSAAADKTMDIDYFQLQLSGLTR